LEGMSDAIDERVATSRGRRRNRNYRQLRGAALSSKGKRCYGKKRKRAEKFEELVAAVFEHMDWINTTRNFQAFCMGSDATVSPMAKIRAISDTYFPEFEAFVEQLDIASNDYVIWMSSAAQRRLRKEPELLAGHDDVLKPYAEKRQALLTELRSFARREFQ
jgi:lysyl-tRNA synthetase class II